MSEQSVTRSNGPPELQLALPTPASPHSPKPPMLLPRLVACVLPGMVARGLGVETLCLYLAISQALLFDTVVSLGLPTPHDRPHRRAYGRNPWQSGDIPIFIELWTDGWAAVSLAERFGRSRNGIWSKARQLGLQRRERRVQFRPADPHAAMQLTLALTQNPSTSAAALLGECRPAASVPLVTESPAAPTIVPRLTIPGVTHAQLEASLNLPPIVRKGEKGEIIHSVDRDLQIALRVFSSQHYVTSAREMGMSVAAFTSRRTRLEIPTMARGESIEEFNIEYAAEMINALGLKRVQCLKHKERGKQFFFWCKQTECLHISQFLKDKM